MRKVAEGSAPFQLAQYGNTVIAVNGVDPPIVIPPKDDKRRCKKCLRVFPRGLEWHEKACKGPVQ